MEQNETGNTSKLQHL